MTKKSILAIVPVMCGALLLGGLTSCGGSSSNPTGTEGTDVPTEAPVVSKFTVTFVDGETTLHTEEVEANAKVSVWDHTETVKDKDFFGWFAEPTLKHAFDFEQPITADTTIFGSFVGYQKDERHWGIAGSGSSSILKSSNWGKTFNEEHYMVNESTDKKNIFTMKLSLFKDDEFQFTDPVISETSIAWGPQRGGGYLVDPVVEEVEYFKGGTSLGGDNANANITCLVDGEYKFTLTTYPAGDFQKDGGPEAYNNRSYYDKITWERLGDPEEVKAAVETTFYIKGEDITGWGDYVNAQTTMTSAEGVHTLKNIYLKATDQFMFASKIKDTTTGEISDGNVYIKTTNLDEDSKALVEGEGNMKVKEDGYYTFTYVEETKVLNVTKSVDYVPAPGEYFFDGSFEGCAWGGAGSADWKLEQSAENADIYTLGKAVTLKEGDEIGLQYYDVDTKGYNGFFSAKNMVATDNFDLVTKNNAICKVAGDYKVEFNAYRHLLTVTPVEK